MASVNAIPLLAILLVLLPITAASSFLTPLLSPVVGNVCQEAQCGKGKCKPSDDMFLFECECDLGWKQTRFNDCDHLKFLPCIIPNCTMNYSCSEAPAPVQEKSTKSNESFFDPCRWTDCGGGSCNKTSMFTYSCECQLGYNNLFNMSTFPCFKECAIGMDCANLGLSAPNESTSPAPPALADNSQNLAGSNLLGNYYFLIILTTSLVMIQ